MPVKLTFLGAAQNVTGSKYLLEAHGTRFLVDCGLYQERGLKDRNWEPFPVPPQTIDAILLTHAHIDHSGFLPRLVQQGFHGPIYCTEATAEIAEIVLLDSARLQEEDAEFKRKRHAKEGRKAPHPVIPLYTTKDAEAVFPLFKSVGYSQCVTLPGGIEGCFDDAGHVLGSAMITVKITQNGKDRTILFSGDVGGRHKPILPHPTLFEEADYVLVESTYGDRLHENVEDLDNTLADIINTTERAGGNIVIPSFALERAQEVLFHLNRLLLGNRIPHLMIFLDSPMATSITEVFQRHPELFNEETTALMSRQESPFNFPMLKLVSTVEESKAINHVKGTVIIIAGAGMCNGGRIKHHLITNITRTESTILFVGYQAIGTLGRQIVDGAKKVRILGQMYPVRARIIQLNGFSAHADRDELFQWLSALKKPPRHLFIVHGETDAAQNFARFVQERTGWEISVPRYLDEVVLD